LVQDGEDLEDQIISFIEEVKKGENDEEEEEGSEDLEFYLINGPKADYRRHSLEKK
jgi:hypothetical protein